MLRVRLDLQGSLSLRSASLVNHKASTMHAFLRCNWAVLNESNVLGRFLIETEPGLVAGSSSLSRTELDVSDAMLINLEHPKAGTSTVEEDVSKPRRAYR